MSKITDARIADLEAKSARREKAKEQLEEAKECESLRKTINEWEQELLSSTAHRAKYNRGKEEYGSTMKEELDTMEGAITVLEEQIQELDDECEAIKELMRTDPDPEEQ